jgi:hypothetical protein
VLMVIPEQNKRIIEKNVKRLALKNTGAAALFGSVIKGAVNGGAERELVSRVFDVDPTGTASLDALVFQSILHHLTEEDIEEIFRRYARRRGFDF